MKAFLVSMLLALVSPSSTTPRAFAAVPSPDQPLPVTLGQSVVALTGPWRFHTGDDPRWADPSFDDSQWETVDLAPTPETTVPSVPIPGFVSGWEARGHPGYAGYAWYRMRVRISGASGPLTLLSPEWFDDAFQVFANGRSIGSFGDFNRPVPERYESRPAGFNLPPADYSRAPDGSTLIAFRFYMTRASLGQGVRGGMHGPPGIGLSAAATAAFHMEWERELRRLASALAGGLLYFLFALLIAMIFAFSRNDKILLLPLNASIFDVLTFGLILSTTAPWMSAVRLEALIVFVRVVAEYLWLLTWWAYFGLQRMRWLLNTILALGACNLVLLEFSTIATRIGRPSPGLLIASSVSNIGAGLAVLAVAAVIAYLGWKRAERGHWPLFLALSTYALPGLATEMQLLNLRTSWQPFGVLIPLDLISNFASLACFSVVLFRQFRTSQRRLQAMEDDVNQAKEIQRLLIPERMPELAGWVIESEYRPAREVGGDFFQIIPDQHEGSLLIVAGDVTGKGLRAGMLVAMLVGATRTESAHTSDPVRILGALNSRLRAGEHAQATCLAIRIDASGRAILANAGHLPPYLNGKPVDMEGALPLGMVEEAQPSVTAFQLKPNDRLVLVSDGIVEATNADGALFGFERLQALLRAAKTVGEVASAAQNFGQEDDISVIAVTHTGAAVPALA